MKHIIYLLALSSFLNMFSQTQPLTEGITVKTSFNGRHCNGQHGLCNIEFLNNDEGLQSNGFLVFKNNVLKLIVYREKMSSKEESNIFYNSTAISHNNFMYNLEYDFNIDNTIINRLKLKPNAHILNKGQYVLKITEETLIIEFKLQ